MTTPEQDLSRETQLYQMELRIIRMLLDTVGEQLADYGDSPATSSLQVARDAIEEAQSINATIFEEMSQGEGKSNS